MFLTRVFFLLLVLVVPVVVMAAPPIQNVPVLPYEALPIDANIESKQVYLGILAGDPHTYEVTIAEPKQFTATLVQRVTEDQVIPFSLIIVKSNELNRGVTEIGRVVGTEISWQTSYDAVLGMKVAQSETVVFDLTPGTYRFEVSTAQNLGKYMIVLGNTPSAAGYFAQVSEIRTIQKFFAASPLRILISTHVLYPLGSFILLMSFLYVWYRNRRVAYAA